MIFVLDCIGLYLLGAIPTSLIIGAIIGRGNPNSED